MKIWERGRSAWSLLQPASWMSKRITKSQWLKISSRPVRPIHTFSVALLLETSFGHFSATAEHYIRAWSRGWIHHQGPKCFACRSQVSTWCWSLLLINRVWLTKNMSLKEKWWVANSTHRCWKGYWSRFSLLGHSWMTASPLILLS